jgi:hypothetical protein
MAALSPNICQSGVSRRKVVFERWFLAKTVGRSRARKNLSFLIH